MDKLDVAIATMIVSLLLLHCMFGLKAISSTARISQSKKTCWFMLSLVLGPIGYYFYQGIIPCDQLSDDSEHQ